MQFPQAVWGVSERADGKYRDHLCTFTDNLTLSGMYFHYTGIVKGRSWFTDTGLFYNKLHFQTLAKLNTISSIFCTFISVLFS